ncbi:MAG: PorT family protein [Bacteroidales bacterium]|jgi:hypothetical protein|nr:PorT family protein [Bacteroidales bacterium]
MKKVILSLALIIGVGATQINAQSITGGIKADANLSNFIVSDMPLTESEMKFGATLGGFLKFDIVKNFAIQPELLFHFQTSTIKTVFIKQDYQYWGMEIPIYAMGQWYTRADHRFYVGVGPYVGFGFDAKYKDPEMKLYKNDIHQPWDFGFGAQLGFEFANGLQFNAGYKIGIIDALDIGKAHATMLPQKVSLGIGYRF